jgi:transcriptional regulator
VARRDTQKTTELLQGTLDLLILKAISLGPLHGYGVLLRLQQISKETLQVPQGSLYPALYRLEHQGLITYEWGESDNKRKAKYYNLTAAGRRRLRDEADYWQRLSGAITLILDAAPGDV